MVPPGERPELAPLLAPLVARAGEPDWLDEDAAEVVVCTFSEGAEGADAVEVIKRVTGPTDVLPALLTAADVVATDETTTTDVGGPGWEN